MHLLSSKPQKATPLIPVVSKWGRPFHWSMRGRRYDARGEYIGPSGPKKPVPDVAAIQALKDAHAAAAKMPRPEEGAAFDLNDFTPLPGRILIGRGPLIKEENGVALPEDQWRSEKWYYVLRVADDVTDCRPGDRVYLQAKTKPRPVDLGGTRFFLTREKVIVALHESI